MKLFTQQDRSSHALIGNLAPVLLESRGKSGPTHFFHLFLAVLQMQCLFKLVSHCPPPSSLYL